MNQEISRHGQRRIKKRKRTGSDAIETEELPSGAENESDTYSKYADFPAKDYKISHSTPEKRMITADSEESSDLREKERFSGKSSRCVESLKAEYEDSYGNYIREDSEDVETDIAVRKKRRKSKRKTVDHSQGSVNDEGKILPPRSRSTRPRGGGNGDADDRRRRRKSRSQAAGEDTSELPITEILKKAQNIDRTKYEEPIPLPELNSDVLYVQGKHGFSAVRIGKDSDDCDKRKYEGKSLRTIEIAILVQKMWKAMGLVYQGLLGGIALTHIIAIQVLFSATLEFILAYSTVSEIYTNVFSFLGVLSVVSSLDKFDVAHLDVEHIREIYVNHPLSAVTIPIYLVMYCLHQVTFAVDEKLTLTYYNQTAWNDSNLDPFFEELYYWKKLTFSKDALAVIAWIFVALGTRADMLLIHLEAMKKYADNGDTLPREEYAHKS